MNYRSDKVERVYLVSLVTNLAYYEVLLQLARSLSHYTVTESLHNHSLSSTELKLRCICMPLHNASGLTQNFA